MAQFMLLLHESPDDFAGLSPEEIQRVIGEYTAWREKLAAEGKLAGGLKLKDAGIRGCCAVASTTWRAPPRARR